MGVTQYLKPEDCPYFFTDRHYDYAHITGFAKKLWDDGKIDLILSRSINNHRRLDTLGIPYVAVFPSEEMIAKSIRSALNELRLTQIRQQDELNILIRLPFSEDVEREEQEYREATVFKYLADFRRVHHMHFEISQGFNQFEIHMPVETDSFEIDGMRPVLSELKRELGFPFRIGIGLSSSRERSRYFSEHALLEANRYGRNDAFFVGEDSTVVGPLSVDTRLISRYSNEKAISFARENGINEPNILKIISLFEQDPAQILGSATLAPLLGVTPRSANRILGKLTELGLLGYADENDTEKAARQGRPAHHYRFLPEYFRAALL